MHSGPYADMAPEILVGYHKGFRNSWDCAPGSVSAETFTDNSGYFWFFTPGNLELSLKVLDGRSINGQFWVFYGALSDVEYQLHITDTLTGVRKTYSNPAGEICGMADTNAFTDPAP